MLILWKGAAVGLAIAAPVGPIGLLCIRRTLAQGRLAGFVCGLGAATADLVYGILAAAGISALNAWLLHRALWLSIGGAIFLIALGVRTWMEKPAVEAVSGGGFSSTFFLTLTNPMTIVSFAGVMAGLGAAASSSKIAPFSIAAGVFLGSAAWWLALTTTTGMLRRWIASSSLRLVNRIAAVMLVGFGLNALRALVSV